MSVLNSTRTRHTPLKYCEERTDMKTIRAFFNGMREFRTAFTTHYDDYDLLESYDLGREWAHRLTFRRYEQ